MEKELPSDAGGLEVFCPIRETLKILGKRWTILIIKEIYYSKPKRLSFMELKRLLGDVSTKMLSERLKEMGDTGLVERTVKDDVKPPRVYYSLTKKGEDSCDILDVLKEYGLKWGGEKVNCKESECELCAEKRMAKIVQRI